MFKLINLYIKCFYCSIFKINSKYAISFQTLYRKHSFKIPLELNKDIFVGVRFFKKAITSLFSLNDNHIKESNKLVYDGDSRQKNDRIKYLKKIFPDTTFDYISVSQLKLNNRGKAIVFLLLFLPLFCLLILVAIFSKKRGVIALSIQTLTQNFILIDLLLKNNYQEVFYFYPFENDANINALYIMEHNIKVIKVPGPNPLHRFHSKMVSNEVVLCAGFQLEQYELYRKTWYVDTVLKWPLYGFQDFVEYSCKKNKEYSYQLGFISSGIWKRLELGIQPLEEGDFSSEIELIQWINKLIYSKNISNLFIYLHPIEKSTLEVYQNAVSFYQYEFKEIELTVIPFETNSFKAFEKCELAVSSHSSTNLQRLFCGYKVLYTPMKFNDKLFPNTSLENISCYDYESFEKKVKESLSISEDDFFIKNGLEQYKYEQNTALT